MRVPLDTAFPLKVLSGLDAVTEAEKLKNAFRSHILLERNKTGIQAHHRAGAQ